MNISDLSLCSLVTGISAALLSNAAEAVEAKTTKAQPTPVNVIYILADDLGYGDLSIMGQKKLNTPNIDRIGNEGLVFFNHYSGNTVCSPSRANLMTGQHPGHVACRSNKTPMQQKHLDPDMTTLPRLFKNAGYATGAFGKWGLGTTCTAGAANPMTHGFDVFSGWKSQMIAHTYYPSSIVRNGKEEKLPEGTYIHDLIMADAFAFIREQAQSKKPFFAYIPTAIPHAAMHAPPDLHNKWRQVFPQFDNKIGRYGAGPEECPPVTNPIAGFAAMMEHLDNQVGELLELLQTLGIDDNTIIMFASDNGAHHEGGHDPNFWDSNGPLRGLKRDFYEGGIRCPFLVRWSHTIKPGRTSKHISAFWDILPTMADLLGQPVPEQSDGISILPTLLGQTDQQREHEYLYWEDSVGNQIKKTALRQGDWKVVRKYSKNTPQPSELFNLKDDIGEQNDLSASFPDLVKRLESLMNSAHRPSITAVTE
jgi:arylsulfatase A-like enzyme